MHQSFASSRPWGRAILAGLLKAPSRLAPTDDPAAAARRGRIVLAAMVAAGFIGPAAMGPANATGQAAAGAAGALMNRKPAIVEHFPYFVDRECAATGAPR